MLAWLLREGTLPLLVNYTCCNNTVPAGATSVGAHIHTTRAATGPRDGHVASEVNQVLTRIFQAEAGGRDRAPLSKAKLEPELGSC